MGLGGGRWKGYSRSNGKEKRSEEGGEKFTSNGFHGVSHNVKVGRHVEDSENGRRGGDGADGQMREFQPEPCSKISLIRCDE